MPAGSWEERYEGVTVDADAIYVRDGKVWTSAGVTAGIDLALALVADDHGHRAAATVLGTCRLPSAIRRAGASRPFSPARQPTPSRYGTCCRGYGTTSPMTSRSPRSPGRSTSPNAVHRVFKSEVGVTAAD